MTCKKTSYCTCMCITSIFMLFLSACFFINAYTNPCGITFNSNIIYQEGQIKFIKLSNDNHFHSIKYITLKNNKECYIFADKISIDEHVFYNDNDNECFVKLKSKNCENEYFDTLFGCLFLIYSIVLPLLQYLICSICICIDEQKITCLKFDALIE